MNYENMITRKIPAFIKESIIPKLGLDKMYIAYKFNGMGDLGNINIDEPSYANGELTYLMVSVGRDLHAAVSDGVVEINVDQIVSTTEAVCSVLDFEVSDEFKRMMFMAQMEMSILISLHNIRHITRSRLYRTDELDRVERPVGFSYALKSNEMDSMVKEAISYVLRTKTTSVENVELRNVMCKMIGYNMLATFEDAGDKCDKIFNTFIKVAKTSHGL